MCIYIYGFHSITSVPLDKLYQGSRNFSEQKFRFPLHRMKLTINCLFCPYKSNQHRSWTVFHSRLSYWWTVIQSNWKNGKKQAQHNKKQGPHSLFLQTGNLPSSSCVSIRIFNLTSLCCFMGYSEIVSWCGFSPHWRPWGDFVDRRFLERGFGINQICFFFSMNLRNLHSTQEAGKLWAFLYEILIIFLFHNQIFP